MNLATHDHLDKQRWVGFTLLVIIMCANYGFIVMACFYGILGSAEDFPELLGACTTAFVLLEMDDVVFRLAARTFFRAHYSARPGASASHAAEYHCRQLGLDNWGSTCTQLHRDLHENCEHAFTGIANCAVASSTTVLWLCVLVLPWAPAFFHATIYEHGFLNGHSCSTEELGAAFASYTSG